MLEPTSDLQPSVAQIVADALMSAADGLARWLGHRIDAKQMVAAPVGGDALQCAIAPPNDVICCCTMPVDWTIIRPEGSRREDSRREDSRREDSRREDESTAPPELQSRSAGRLLLGWSAADAAWLIDESLHQTGTSSDQSTWGNLQRSAIAETSNVVGCDFLNAIAQSVRDISTTEVSLIPRPPHVSQQFAGSLLDSAIIEVESASSRNDPVWVASGNFQVAGHPACTRFVMVWSPNVWKQLIKLVDGAGNGEEST